MYNIRPLSIYIWGNYTLPPEVFTHFHFCLQSLKCDTLPPQTFKLWQFNPFDLFIPKIPPAQFFQKKKKPKNKKQVAGHHLWGGSATPTYIYIFFWVFFFEFFFFFLEKKSVGGILGINRPNGLNYHNLKVWGGKVSHFKL
jgi:hypothetical protein